MNDEKNKSIDFETFKKMFDESFAKVKPEDFIKQMEALGYEFESIEPTTEKPSVLPKCPKCKGDDIYPEHNIHSVDEEGNHDCSQCPIPVQCEQCYATGLDLSSIDIIATQQSRIEQLEREVERLKELARKYRTYSSHSDFCLGTLRSSECTCGLTKLISDNQNG